MTHGKNEAGRVYFFYEPFHPIVYKDYLQLLSMRENFFSQDEKTYKNQEQKNFIMNLLYSPFSEEKPIQIGLNKVLLHVRERFIGVWVIRKVKGIKIRKKVAYLMMRKKSDMIR